MTIDQIEGLLNNDLLDPDIVGYRGISISQLLKAVTYGGFRPTQKADSGWGVDYSPVAIDQGGDMGSHEYVVKHNAEFAWRNAFIDELNARGLVRPGEFSNSGQSLADLTPLEVSDIHDEFGVYEVEYFARKYGETPEELYDLFPKIPNDTIDRAVLEALELKGVQIGFGPEVLNYKRKDDDLGDSRILLPDEDHILPFDYVRAISIPNEYERETFLRALGVRKVA